MSEFWEASFQEKQTMWGFDPAKPAIETARLFQEHGFNKVLIPGFGYGRNTQPFTNKGMNVTGIEVSETAIDLAREHFGNTLKIHHGNVSEMPFDETQYDGVFCYALIHLLDEPDREKLIKDCYNQLKPGGYMVFVAISTSDSSYGSGEPLGKDQFLSPHGVRLFFYDQESVSCEFGPYGLLESREVTQSAQNRASKSFWNIICKKEM